MEKIASFRINHLVLMPGIYVSRIDSTPSGDKVTTFDVRMTAPNREPALSISALHTIEHLAATFLRNDPEWSERIVYWGPMGCCTGNYLLVQGEVRPEEVLSLMQRTFRFIVEFEGDVPGATPRDCGNYLLMNLPEARIVAKRYLEILESGKCPMEYPAE